MKRLITCLIYTLMQHSRLAQSLEGPTASRYSPLPAGFELRKVVVIHRHGDRAQISRSLGEKYPESKDLTAKWHSLLPTEQTCRAMLSAAHQGKALVVDSHNVVDVKQSLYAGWDKVRFPYAQLTQVGFQQMSAVGKELRSRYVGTLLTGDIRRDSGAIYCRSTNMCRTSQSLRSLLVGLFEINPGEHNAVISPEHLQGLPKINTLHFEQENMFPQGGRAMVHRKSIIFPPELPLRCVPNYAMTETRMRRLLGIPSPKPINWLTVMEVLHCHRTHGIKHIEGLTAEDLRKATEIAAWHEGVLYKVRWVGMSNSL